MYRLPEKSCTFCSLPKSWICSRKLDKLVKSLLVLLSLDSLCPRRFVFVLFFFVCLCLFYFSFQIKFWQVFFSFLLIHPHQIYIVNHDTILVFTLATTTSLLIKYLGPDVKSMLEAYAKVLFFPISSYFCFCFLSTCLIFIYFEVWCTPTFILFS